jgi:threonine dehydrogenase-like Zn-dependent dehydrogenase
VLAGEIYDEQKVRLIEIDEPTLPSDSTGEIVFEPQLACLCGSDLTYFQKTYPEFDPKVGQSLHEMIGTVKATSGNRFQVGDKVLCVPVKHLGLWERFRISETRAIPVDPRASDIEQVLAQPLGTVVCALRKVPHLIDLNVAVVGQGPMGQLFCAALRNVGARNIIAIDTDAQRLETSKIMGANHVVDASAGQTIEAVKEANGGNLVDLVVEVVGHREQTLNLCSDLCRQDGEILFFGVPPQQLDGVEWGPLFWKNINVRTTVGPDFERDFPLAMRWIAEKRIDVNPIVTHHYKLDEIQPAFDTFFNHQDGALKVFVEYPSYGS